MSPEEDCDATVEEVVDALVAIGFQAVVVCSDGSQPCASLDLGNGTWLDITAQVREA